MTGEPNAPDPLPGRTTTEWSVVTTMSALPSPVASAMRMRLIGSVPPMETLPAVAVVKMEAAVVMPGDRAF